jgi:hypothetical protein
MLSARINLDALYTIRWLLCLLAHFSLIAFLPAFLQSAQVFSSLQRSGLMSLSFGDGCQVCINTNDADIVSLLSVSYGNQ